MAHAIRIHEHGGPEALALDEITIGDPGPGQVRVRHTAIGVNFIDTYHRTGLYPVESFPAGLGMEAVGVVTAVGDGVDHLEVGDRAATCTAGRGAYATERLVQADAIVTPPSEISDEHVAAVLLKGLTAQYLIRQIHPVTAGETILVHAAAGGVGVILSQWASALGATVIGTVGSEAKAEIAREAGCAHVIQYRHEDVPARVRQLTGGAGVPVVYDGVGAATWLGSLDSLAPRGLLVSFGNASGPVEHVNLGLLAQKGSLFVTRPTLFHYAHDRASLTAMADDLFDAITTANVTPQIGGSYPLREAAQAHRDLEARRTTGSLVLVPETS
jgi:NADPH2:quinone reductase